MVQLLQIAMACVSVVHDQRPSMQDTVRIVEDMSRVESTNDAFSNEQILMFEAILNRDVVNPTKNEIVRIRK